MTHEDTNRADEGHTPDWAEEATEAVCDQTQEVIGKLKEVLSKGVDRLPGRARW